MGGMFLPILAGIGRRAQEVTSEDARKEESKRKTLAETYMAIAVAPDVRPEIKQAVLNAALTIQQTPYDKKLPKEVLDFGELIASVPGQYPQKPEGTGDIGGFGEFEVDPIFAQRLLSQEEGKRRSAVYITQQEQFTAQLQQMMQLARMQNRVGAEGEAAKYNVGQERKRVLGASPQELKYEAGLTIPEVVMAPGSTLVPPKVMDSIRDTGEPYTAPRPPTATQEKQTLADRLYADQIGANPLNLDAMQHAKALAMYEKVISGRGSLRPVLTTDDGTPTGNPIVKYLYDDQIEGLAFAQRLTAGEIGKAGQGEKLALLINKIKTLALGPQDPITGEYMGEGIFEAQGVIARLTGWWKHGMAFANKAPAVTEYNALLVGFSPILARSIGHTGVLTQVDVESVIQLFPKLGDGREEAERKLANVMDIMGGGDMPFAFGQPGDPAFWILPSGETLQTFDGGQSWHPAR